MTDSTTQTQGHLDETTFRSEYSPELMEHYDEHQKPEWSFHQNVLYSLTTQTLKKYRSTAEHKKTVNTNLQDLMSWGSGVTFSFVLLSVVYFVLFKISLSLTDIALWFTVLTCLIVCYMMFLTLSKDLKVELVREEEKVIGFRLGRMLNVLRLEGSSVISGVLGFAIGCQLALLYFTSNHLGVLEAVTLTDCFWITLDNLLHAITFDFFEIYNFHLGPVIKKHSWYSASSFLLFRLAFDALFLLYLFVLIRRESMLQFVKGMVFDFDKQISKTNASLPDIRSEWLRWYSDEFLFLMLLRQYLRGNFAVVRYISQQFRTISVKNSLRELFLEPQTHEYLFALNPEEEANTSNLH